MTHVKCKVHFDFFFVSRDKNLILRRLANLNSLKSTRCVTALHGVGEKPLSCLHRFMIYCETITYDDDASSDID